MNFLLTSKKLSLPRQVSADLDLCKIVLILAADLRRDI